MNLNLHTLNSLTDLDRLNLCDIAWFLRGINYGKDKADQPFSPDHFQTLEHIIGGITNKLSDEKMEFKRSQCKPNQ